MAMPMAPLLAESHVEQLLGCTTANETVRASSTLGAVLRSIRDAGRVDPYTLCSFAKNRPLRGQKHRFHITVYMTPTGFELPPSSPRNTRAFKRGGAKSDARGDARLSG